MSNKKEPAVKISILVPIYNVEKYLRQCLDSLVNQTLKDIEIICENKHMNVRLQITDMRCVDVMRLDERKPFYQVVNQQEEIHDYIISRIFDN